MSKAVAAYVPVRVVNMAGVDLNLYDFDRALTFAALLMNADGTVYHRYGSGDGRDSMAKVSETSFLRLLNATLEEHAAHEKARPPAPVRARRTVEDLPPMKRRLAKGKVDCVHCHTVGDMERELAEEENRWSRDAVWKHPPAERLGMTLDRDDQEAITAVRAGSPAAKAGVAAGDRLVRVAGARVRTEADVRFALDALPGGAASVAIETRRGVAAREVTLALEAGWRRGDAIDLSWRNDLWHMRPNPGFGGSALSREEKAKLGLPPDGFALKVGYLIDFGPHPEDGRAAKKAGLKKGDVVFGVDGVASFEHERHFQAWWRLTREVGKTAVLDVLSNGERKKILLPVNP
jgi:membrane-associated protease RseP (regulator of RpoE activity)